MEHIMKKVDKYLEQTEKIRSRLDDDVYNTQNKMNEIIETAIVNNSKKERPKNASLSHQQRKIRKNIFLQQQLRNSLEVLKLDDKLPRLNESNQVRF
jgi:hypothetical protein